MTNRLTDDQRRIGLAILVVPVTFAVAVWIEMNAFMALVLGLLIALRVLFPNDRRVLIGTVVALIVWAIALPLFQEESGGFIDDAVLALAYVVMALGLNIIVGFAGLLDLGFVAFFALGALTAGWLMSGFFGNAGANEEGIHILVSGQAEQLPGIHMNFLIVVVAAVIVCAIAGTLIGLPTLRLRGDYIAIVTLAFGEIIGRIVLNGDEIELGSIPLVGGPLESLFGNGATFSNGRQGITPIDKVDLPFVAQFEALNLRPWFWLALALVLIVLFVNYRLRDSRLGRAWIALREDEVAAASMGVPLVKTKLMAYATGAAFGGISGAFLASFLNTVNADQFAFSFSIFVLAMVILGGLGSIEGVVVGAIALSYINTRLIPDTLNDVPQQIGLDFDLTEFSFGIFGFLLVFMMILRPEGLIPERRRKMELTEGIGAGDTELGGGETMYEARA
jgi:branched-chain amino acid transport system permease protein